MASMSEKKLPVRVGVIGINHGHIYSMVNALIRGGATIDFFYAREPELALSFSKTFPFIQQARSEGEILENEDIHMVATAGINSERAPLGIKAMLNGKDFMTDKPGFTSLNQLDEVKRVQKETNRIFSVCFSERLENRSSVKAGDLVAEGKIGKVVQTIGLGPHRANLTQRPDWFFKKNQYGGILCDIASHQFDQFLFFTGATSAQVAVSQIGNFNHPDYPEFEDFGDAIVRSPTATGYIRVDWFTPDGLPVWGDGRLLILGTEGYIELRKYIDLHGRPGGDHLFIVDHKGTQYVDCSHVELPYGPNLVRDVLERTETAIPQAHVFLASELALTAEKEATWITKL
jgi:predicted dehydrogenase